VKKEISKIFLRKKKKKMKKFLSLSQMTFEGLFTLVKVGRVVLAGGLQFKP
jgi:hypothetical protein